MILAQHGHGHSDRVEVGLRDGSLGGVIVSASNIAKGQLADYFATITSARSDAMTMIDPQFYVNFMQDADKFGKLAGYPYFSHPMAPSDLASPKLLQQSIQQVIDLQLDLGLKKIITPTIEITSFGSANEPYALSLLHGSVEYAADKGLTDIEVYGSLLINENAFLDAERMAVFLDAITRVRTVAGFYVIVDRSDSPKNYWTNPQSLATYMYLVHTLSTSKTVILGYSDGAGLLGVAVGAKYIGHGWWMNSGNFTKKRFVSGGGRRRAMYYSKQLMCPIYVDGELSTLVAKGAGSQVAGSTKYDTNITVDPLNSANWNERDAVFHKWLILSQEDAALSALTTENERLELLEQKITTAKDLSEAMNSLLPDGFNSGLGGPEKLRTWLAALEHYKKGVL